MDERFRRAGAILGDAAMKKLSESRVAVLGLGGVGSWCAEALCRSGVGTLYLLDQDTVSLSNVNRQLFALTSTLDLPKAEAAAARLRDIAPESRIVPMVYRYAPETRDTLLDLKPDFIVDCIDLVSCKVDLAVSCAERGIRLVAALGTGNKKDASLLRLTDLAKTEGCPACARCAARAAPPGHHAPAGRILARGGGLAGYRRNAAAGRPQRARAASCGSPPPQGCCSASMLSRNS